MKKSVKIILIVSIAVVLIAAAALLLPSLLKKEEWTPMNRHLPMSKNGLVSWTPFVSAIGYGYYFVDENGNRGEQGYTERPYMQLPAGYALNIFPVHSSHHAGPGIWYSDIYRGRNGKLLAMDEKGLVSWEPVKKAVGYGYCFVDVEGNDIEEGYTEETSVQLKEGRCLRMWPVYANGRKGKARLSEHYTPPVKVKPESNGADQWIRLGTDGN